MMTTDELEGVVPDPNPLIKCGGCGEGYHYEDYWEQRYVEADDVNHFEETWLCDDCKRIEERKESNYSLAQYQQSG